MLPLTRHWRIWNAIRDLDRESLLVLLARSLKGVSSQSLDELIGDLEMAGSAQATDCMGAGTLVGAVEDFCEKARQGVFYKELWVQGRPLSLKSPKTEEFGALLTLLFDHCVEQTETGDPGEVCKAYEMLFDLLREIDRFERDDIVFWADEPGTWQLGLDWARILPPYLACLSRLTKPEEFQQRTDAVIAEFASAAAAKVRSSTAALLAMHRSDNL